MGRLDLDPASSVRANAIARADRFFTFEQDGLTMDWFDRVWMNPPYGKGPIAPLCEKLASEHARGNVDEAVALVNNATETKWFSMLTNHAEAMCLPQGRIKFLDAGGRVAHSPLQGQAFLYLGENSAAFDHEFRRFGRVWH
jgi:hypothetical protein